MISVYIAFGIICLIFWICYFTYDRYQKPESSKKRLVFQYIIARILPMLFYGERNMMTWTCLIMEWIILLILSYYLDKNEKQEDKQDVISFYLFCPAIFPLLILGNTTYMIVILAFVLIYCLLDIWADHKNTNLRDLLIEYLVLSISVYGQMLLIYASVQKIIVLQETLKAIMILSLISMIRKIVTRQCGKTKELRQEHQIEISHDDLHKKKFNKIDFLWMMVLTAIFAIVVFLNLGSTKAPKTYLEMATDQNNELILEFGKETKISKIEVFLGYKGKRSYDISIKSKDDQEWRMISKDHIIQSVFAWNEILIDQNLAKLEIKLKDEDARIHEIICFDQNGKIIKPINYKKYSNLFDEQSMYPETLTYYEQTMFDEVYHARTAYEFLHTLSIYENTHPPLGKILISFGIALFGMNPFGWRFICAMAGVLMIPLLYLWAHLMFGRTKYAVYTTVLIQTLFMNLTLSRIATIDILVALFVMGMFAAMFGYVKCLQQKEDFKKQMLWLLMSGCFMALSVSTKWTGVYAAGGIAILFFVNFFDHIKELDQSTLKINYMMKTFFFFFFCFIVIPGTVYILSYIPFAKVYTNKNLIQNALSNAQLMLSYHSKTVFDHPYSSQWYEWLIDKRPLLDSYSVYKDGGISTVATFINPLICFGGLIAFFYQFYLIKKKKDMVSKYLIIAYLSVLVP